MRNRTILCSAVSCENFDTKSSPICRVSINVPPCLVATEQSTAKCHKTHIYSTRHGGTLIDTLQIGELFVSKFSQLTAEHKIVSVLTTSIAGRVSLPAEDTQPTCRLTSVFIVVINELN